MNKYNNGKIYKIVDNTSDMVYVGSTCITLKQRLKNHEYHYKSFKAGKIISNLSSFQILKNENYSIELIEYYPCENKKDLEKRETYYIKLYKNNIKNFGKKIINKNIPRRTKKEYRAEESSKIRTNDNKMLYCDKCQMSFKKRYKYRHDKLYFHRKNMGLITNINGDNNDININIFCKSKDDINDLVELEKDFINTIYGNNNNITINIKPIDDLEQLELDFLNAIKI